MKSNLRLDFFVESLFQPVTQVLSKLLHNQKEIANYDPIINHKSIFEGKKAIGFDDLDFEIVREIKSATKYVVNEYLHKT